MKPIFERLRIDTFHVRDVSQQVLNSIMSEEVNNDEFKIFSDIIDLIIEKTGERKTINFITITYNRYIRLYNR